jgi:transcriptional regulator with XRE-family HTH domain
MQGEPSWLERLARLRHQAGVSQETIARKLGLNERNLRHREKGRFRLSVAELAVYVVLCDLTDAQIVELVRGAAPPRLVSLARKAA